MKKIKALLAALAVVLASLVAVGSSMAPAEAAGCGAPFYKDGGYLTKNGPGASHVGGVHEFQMHIRTQECTGYDIVLGVHVYLYKSGGACKNSTGTTKITSYVFNPNVIDGWNPGSSSSTCNGGTEFYNTLWIPPGGTGRIIYSNQPENDRCIGAVVKIAGQGFADIEGTVPSVCFNGL